MTKKDRQVEARTRIPLILLWIAFGGLFVLGFLYAFQFALEDESMEYVRGMTIEHKKIPVLDKRDYNIRLLRMSGFSVATSSTSTVPELEHMIASSSSLWPAKNLPYPKVGAILPFNRIVAYYGNFYSKGMGVLGQYPEEEMLAKFRTEIENWTAADPDTPVVPAIHYIVTTAQGLPQKDGSYSLRMPDSQIDRALELAKKINGIVFIDFQIGKSTVQKELPLYENYITLPNVHIGVDPEFSMKGKAAPGKEIGVLDAADINWVIEYMADIVRKHDLPPKVLVIHRFTHDMVTHADKIRPLPEVQFVMDMDGWGDMAKKNGTYTHVIVSEPVQFTGFKLFYKNDLLPPSTGMYTPKELLQLVPQPMYIQYQ